MKKPKKDVKKAAPGKIRVSGALDSNPFIEDVDLKAAWEREYRTRWTSPAMAISVPTGFGADWGALYLGTSFYNRTQFSQIADGAAFFGTGIGDATKNLGIEVTLSVVNLDPFAQDMALSGKIHRSLGKGFGISLGAENALIVAGDGIDQTQNYYVAVSKFISLKDSEMLPMSQLLLSVGAGNGRFTNATTLAQAKNNYRPFGSIGLRALPWLGIAGAWTGRDVDLGVSAAPFRSFRLTITAGVHDVANLANRPRAFSLTFAYGESFFSDTFPFFTVKSL